MRVIAFCRTDAERAALLDLRNADRRMIGFMMADAKRRTGSRQVDYQLQLGQAVSRAELGNAEAARRCAELFELANDETGARPYWRYAAALGDEDARDYVESILQEPTPVAMERDDEDL